MLRILVVVHIDAYHLPGILALRGHEVEVRRIGPTVLSRIVTRPVVARVPIAVLALAPLLLPFSLALSVPASLARGPPVVGVVTRGLHAGRALLVLMRLPRQGISSLRIGAPGIGCSSDAALLGGTSVAPTAIAIGAFALAVWTLVVHLGLAGGRMGHGKCRLLAARCRLMAVASLLLARTAVRNVLLLRFAIRVKGIVGVGGELLPG